MSFFSNLPIRHKLAVTITGITLLLSLSTLIITASLDIKDVKTIVINNAKLEAHLIGEYSKIALSFDDTLWGEHVIEKLRTIPFILDGYIYDNKGNAFANYHKNDLEFEPSKEEILNEDKNDKSTIVIIESIKDSADTVGSILIKVSLEQIEQRKMFYYKMGFILTIVLILLSWLLSNYVQKFFSNPISALATSVDKIAKEDNYTLRVDYVSKDEIGTLYKQINTMLEQIYVGRKELEKNRSFLNNIIDSMPSILIGIDSNGNITRINNKAEEIALLTREEVKGSSVSNVFPSYAAYLEEIKLTIRNKQTIIKNGIKNIKTGQIVDMTAYPLVANGIEGAVIRIDDVTDKVRLEEMMVQTEKMMSVGGLAAGMAHEINNPLGIIAQGAQNILQKIDPKINANIKAAESAGIKMEQLHNYFTARHIPEFVSDIREATSRAASIVSNMLKFSRKSTSDKKEVNIETVIENTINLVSTDYDLKKRYDFKNIKIEKEYAPDIPKIFICETEIEQVLLNLFKNGAQAIFDQKENDKNKEHKFIIRLNYNSKDLIIEIEDNGPGMSEDIRKRVFEPFFTTKPIGLGTGLGLSVSFMIISNYHNGTINVESTLGKGTKFIITLPY